MWEGGGWVRKVDELNKILIKMLTWDGREWGGGGGGGGNPQKVVEMNCERSLYLIVRIL